jgi:flagellar protein FlaJ
MNSSRSSPKRSDKSSSKANKAKLKPVSSFDLFYQLTYMSAMSAAGITRSKTFEIAALSNSPAGQYFVAINTLVDELRYDYPEACRAVGERAKSEEVKSFLLRLADALRSGEPPADFLAREAKVQGDNYENAYERDLEALKKWSDAFSSIIVSVALIVIINLVSTMIYQVGVGLIIGLVVTAVVMGFFGAWVLSRAAPQEKIIIDSQEGSTDQKGTVRLFRMIIPIAVISGLALVLFGVPMQYILIWSALLLLPVGLSSYKTDRKINKKEAEISSFLRSIGGMATSTGTTLKGSLTKVDLSSFPTLEKDIDRLSTRLQALVSPAICWHRFGRESGSQLIKESIDIFFEAVRLGGDPERVGYLCSLFASRTALLRAKRRVVVETFSWLTLVMHMTVAGLMIFVLEILHNFLAMMNSVIDPEQAELAAQSLATPLANFSPGQLQILDSMTVVMVILLAVVSAVAIIVSDGGYKYKMLFYLSALLFMSGICFWAVPPIVAKILVV